MPVVRREVPALESLLSRRIVLVAGKGGAGKTTVTAALALLAAQAGKRVLAIEADAKGALAGALGSVAAGFQPRVVQPRVSVIELLPEESLQEYLRIYFKVPRFTRLTPLSRIFHFIAAGVPGPRDMLTIGKIAYEEKQRDAAGRPRWDILIVDCTASGHVLPQLGAAREMLRLTRGGIIRAQIEWIDATLSDPLRTVLVLCALPEEMAVSETIELHDRVLRDRTVCLGPCVLNRTLPPQPTPTELRVLQAMSAPELAGLVDQRLGGSVVALRSALGFAAGRATECSRQRARLRSAIGVPVVDVPVQVMRPGMAMSRAVADVLGASWRP